MGCFENIGRAQGTLVGLKLILVGLKGPTKPIENDAPGFPLKSYIDSLNFEA